MWLGRSTKRELLCGLGGQSLLLKTDWSKTEKSLQHSNPHTRLKVARDYLEEVEAYEQQLNNKTQTKIKLST